MRQKLFLLWALALLLPFSQAWAAEPLSPKDSLSADGPYILYGADGVNIIRVDTQGNILQNHWDQLPENYSFQVTDHRGQYPFEVQLRPFKRAAWLLQDTPERTFVMSDPHGRLDCVVNLLQGNQVIDTDLHWVYGPNRLVVIGDIADRGKDGIIRRQALPRLGPLPTRFETPVSEPRPHSSDSPA